MFVQGQMGVVELFPMLTVIAVAMVLVRIIA